MVRIALPSKGRLAEDVRILLADAGLDARGGSERTLSLPLAEGLEALLVRAQDVPELVADGAADAGVTGLDLVCESGRPLVELLDLALGRCRLVLAAPEGVRVGAGARVATSFPRLAGQLLRERGLEVEVVPISGATEIAPRLGIADAIVDLVSTGSTLRVNGLVELATLLTSTARLVTRPGLDPQLAAALDDLALTVGSVVRARASRYVMANAPRSELDRVRAVLPGIDGPTVTELLRAGRMVAVHAVVPSAAVPRTVRDLKGLGCTGILVTRVERMVP